jgi:hypothetical protein
MLMGVIHCESIWRVHINISVATAKDFAIPRETETRLDSTPTALQLIESALTSAAIIVGGVWAYFLFWKRRINYPRVALEIEITSAVLPQFKRLVHITLRIENRSDILVSLDRAQVRLRQVVPTPVAFDQALVPGIDPIPPGHVQFPWPAIVQRDWTFSPKLELEPGESDSLDADFVIEASVKVAEVYAFVPNPRKTKTGLGWPITLVHTFDEALNMVEQDKAVPARRDWYEKQQRQQPQQPSQQVQQQQQRPQLPNSVASTPAPPTEEPQRTEQ